MVGSLKAQKRSDPLQLLGRRVIARGLLCLNMRLKSGRNLDIFQWQNRRECGKICVRQWEGLE